MKKKSNPFAIQTKNLEKKKKKLKRQSKDKDKKEDERKAMNAFLGTELFLFINYIIILLEKIFKFYW